MPVNESSPTFSRRTFLAGGTGAIAASLNLNLLGSTAVVAAPLPAPSEATSDALKRLLEGNQRHVQHKLTYPHHDQGRLLEVAKAQHPFAVILSCADSRVPPEVVFDQGLGDLFVVRVAGNILDNAILGSIEYATEYLQVPLVMVLGHERCGAVTAAIQGGKALPHIRSLIAAIQPAVNAARERSGDLLDNAVRSNVQMVVEQMKGAEPLASSVKDNKLQIVGGHYDLDRGTVEVIA